METLIAFCLACYGSAAIVAQGSIFKSMRLYFFQRLKKPYNTFFMCPLCLGFWFGLFYSLIGIGVTGLLFTDAVIGSGAAFAISQYILPPQEEIRECRNCK